MKNIRRDDDNDKPIKIYSARRRRNNANNNFMFPAKRIRRTSG